MPVIPGLFHSVETPKLKTKRIILPNFKRGIREAVLNLLSDDLKIDTLAHHPYKGM